MRLGSTRVSFADALARASESGALFYTAPPDFSREQRELYLDFSNAAYTQSREFLAALRLLSSEKRVSFQDQTGAPTTGAWSVARIDLAGNQEIPPSVVFFSPSDAGLKWSAYEGQASFFKNGAFASVFPEKRHGDVERCALLFLQELRGNIQAAEDMEEIVIPPFNSVPRIVIFAALTVFPIVALTPLDNEDFFNSLTNF